MSAWPVARYPVPRWSITAERQAPDGVADLAGRLRAAGCVFADDEARILTEAATRDGVLDPGLLDTLVRRREQGEPPEHIVGGVEFAGLRLSVGPGVFIPRRRSAFLAGLAVEAVGAMRTRAPRPVLVEAFCGVAPIAATVAARLGTSAARLIAVDHRSEALRHARTNLPCDALVARAELPDGMADILHAAGVPGSVDVLAAVAPYVPTASRALLPAEAVDHEPADSHDGGHDGLDAVRGLLTGARRWCAPGGVVLCECHRGQAPAAQAFAADLGFDCRVHHSDDGQTAVIEVLVPRWPSVAQAHSRG